MIDVANVTKDERILMTDELRIIKSEQNTNVFCSERDFISQ